MLARNFAAKTGSAFLPNNHIRIRLLVVMGLLLALSINMVAALPVTVQPASSSTAGKTLAPGTFATGLVAVKFRPNVNPLTAKAGYNYAEIRPDKYFSQEPFREFELSKYEMDRALPGIFYYHVSPTADVAKLVELFKADPQVEFAEPNYTVKLEQTSNDPYYTSSTVGRQYYLDKINIQAAWDVTTGSSNVVVAVLDTGIRINHLDAPLNILRSRARTFVTDQIQGQFLQAVADTLLPAGQSEPPLGLPVGVPGSNDIILSDGFSIYPSSGVPDPTPLKPYYAAWDPNGHGTAVAGIIAANTNNGYGMAGINWNITLLPVQVINSLGVGTDISIASGITYAADNRARIINLSLGNHQQSEVITEAVRYAQNKGVIIVAAAGNEVTNSPAYPASIAGVIGVGATDSNDRLATFSNFGAGVSVVAPGTGIWTSYCNFLDTFEATNVPPGSTIPGSCEAPQPKGDTIVCNSADNDPTNPEACLTQNLVRYWRVETITPPPSPPATPTPPVITNYLKDLLTGSYRFVNGTSFSAPIVTGIVALMVSIRPDIPNDVVQSILQQTADRVPGMVSSGRDPNYGFGRVNAGKALVQLKNGDVFASSKTLLQGVVQGATLPDVVMSLDQGDRNTSIVKTVDTNTGGYRFENLAAATYYLRALLPKQNRVLGPVLINSKGLSGEVINVNFDFASNSVVAGPGAQAPGQGQPSPQPSPNPPVLPPQPAPLLSPNAVYFQPLGPQPSTADRYYFPEVGHTLGGTFKRYWDSHGGLPIFGFPISEEFQEVSATDGKIHVVQYFERNRFEYHSEFAGSNNEVLLGLLGSELTKGRDFPPAQSAATTGRYFPETKHTLTDRFYNYWQNNGGLAIFGYPISEPFMEGGYLVQYFERNRFEYHPENAGTKYEVLLGLLGVDLARSRNYIAPAPKQAVILPDGSKGD